MLSRVDASELALQLHRYLDGLNDEAVRDFAVVFALRLPAETRSLLFTTLEKSAESDVRATVRSADAQRLKFAMASVLWTDQSAADAIPALVQDSLATYRAFVFEDDFAAPPQRRRRILPYAGIAIVAVLAIFVLLIPAQRAHLNLRFQHWIHHQARAAAVIHKTIQPAAPVKDLQRS